MLKEREKEYSRAQLLRRNSVELFHRNRIQNRMTELHSSVSQLVGILLICFPNMIATVGESTHGQNFTTHKS